MSRTVRVSITVMILPLLLGMSGCLEKMDASGSWVGFFVWEAGDSYEGEATTVRLELVQDRRVITGTVHLDADFMDLDMEIVSGEGSNYYVTLDTAGAASDGETPHAIFVHLEGLIDGSRINGTGTFTVDGVQHSFTWQAQRSS